MRPFSILSLVAILLFAGSACASEILVTSLVNSKDEPLTKTKKIECIRYVSVKPESEVWTGMALEPGDLLLCESESMGMQITVSESTFDFDSPFRIEILPTEDGFTPIDLGIGTVAVHGDSTAIIHGETVMGARGTKYKVSIHDRDGRLSETCVVFEGKVDVRSPRESKVLEAAQKLDIGGSRLSTVKPTTAADVERGARLFARMDIGKASIPKGTRRADAYSDLVAAHMRALQEPDNVGVRMELATKQVNLNLPKDALSQLRGATRDQQDLPSDEKAKLHLIRGVAYDKLGRPDEARSQVEQAVEADRRAASSDLELFELDSEWVTRVKHGYDAQAYLFDLIANKKYKEAKVGFQGRIESKQADSRDYFGLATAHSKLKEKGPACLNARKALALDRRDSKLTTREIERANNLAKSCPKTMSARQPLVNNP